MKTLLICLLLSAILGSALSAICVEMCSLHDDLDIPKCPDGFVCRSNGCGHTCQPELGVGKREPCPLVRCIPCSTGIYEYDENGCQTCQCLQA
ncbi:BPTI/Kunitz domain-containing protein 4 [Biomphalaria glabrata]|uniref:BPTI/Kunitz domain-containing protein 4-like n=1 Tax=Biomphalaria glabrata TaxID=6526 RepID=A0A9W2ZJE7_BIOGL|nr:BPTI/Kunitz domain-containing protein 4-like [Biomphalaria glabrata]KAI8766557.1 BPTI/Kunitz domain-containing protein 4-like [Biomphalaria glabrata]